MLSVICRHSTTLIRYNRYEEILPGHPKPHEYKFVNMNPYKMQQRCAPSFHKGKIILAADAAHVCNPFGGLGLTGGIADVGSLYDCLLGIHKGLADDSIIEKYSQVRMQIYKDVIDPMSRDNFRRISQQDPDEAGEKDEFFQLCKKAAIDEDFSKEMCMVGFVLRFSSFQPTDTVNPRD